MIGWWDGPIVGFDLETTGVDVETARIVTAHLNGVNWLVAVDEDIPDAATAIHGITTEHAKTWGRPLTEVAREAYINLVNLADSQTPVCGFNISYDLTVLDREFRRIRDDTVCVIPAHLIVIDALVLDKQHDQYRRGKRRLTDVAAVYGVPLAEGEAHGAQADAAAAVGVAREILTQKAHAGEDVSDLYVLHQQQVRWRWSQQQSLQEYLRRADPDVVTDKHWPIIPKGEM